MTIPNDSVFPWRDAQERFRGRTEGALEDHERRLGKYEDDFHEMQVNVAQIKSSVDKLGVKFALASMISALVASGVVSVVVLWVGHHL